LADAFREGAVENEPPILESVCFSHRRMNTAPIFLLFCGYSSKFRFMFQRAFAIVSAGIPKFAEPFMTFVP
jgi:hypothetical protein